MARLRVRIPDIGEGNRVVTLDGVPVDGVVDIRVDVLPHDATMVTIRLHALDVDIEQTNDVG